MQDISHVPAIPAVTEVVTIIKVIKPEQPEKFIVEMTTAQFLFYTRILGRCNSETNPNVTRGFDGYKEMNEKCKKIGFHVHVCSNDVKEIAETCEEAFLKKKSK